MPKKNTDNLKTVRSEEEARKLGTIGGRKSGEARRKKRDMREYMQALLDTQQDGTSGAEAIALALFEKALSGDVKACEAVMASVGQTPRQTVPPIDLPELDSAADLPKLTSAIFQAVTQGQLAPSEANALASLVGCHSKALETADLEQRITALEQRAKEKTP